MIMRSAGAALEFRHVDVLTDVPFAGNGLIVEFGNPAARVDLPPS